MALSAIPSPHDNRYIVAGDWHAHPAEAKHVIDLAVKEGIDTIIHVGDFGFYDNDSYLKETNNYLKRHNVRILAIDGNHECVSEDTKAITREGAKHYSDLKIGDEVLSVEDNGDSVWLPIENIIVKDHSGDMVSVQSRGMNMLLTPNHRVVYRGHANAFKESLAKDLTAAQKRIVRAGTNSKTDDLTLSDDEIRLYAWIMTDSWREKARGYLRFSQKESNAYRITELLDRLSVGYSKSTRNRKIESIAGKTLLSNEPEVTIRVSVDGSRKYPWLKGVLDPVAHKWSKRQVDLFLEEYIFCDGTQQVGTARRNTGVLYSVDPRILQDLKVLLLTNGYRVSEYSPREGDHRLNVCDRPTVMIHRGTKTTQPTSIETVQYSGTVWCVQVANGRFFVERGGIPYLTGNCFPYLYSHPIDPETGLRPVRSNIFHLPRNTRWEWDGVSFLALGGAQSIDVKFRTEGKSWWPEERITPEEAQTAIEGGHADVMFTHDAPTSFPNQITSSHRGQMEAMRYFGAQALADCRSHQDLLESVTDVVQPHLLFHGHYHVTNAGWYRHDYDVPAYGISLNQGLFNGNAHITSTSDNKVLIQTVEDARKEAALVHEE